MCGMYAYKKENGESTDATKFGGGRPIPDDSTTIYLVYLCVKINFIDTRLNVLAFFFRALVCLSIEDEITPLKNSS